MTEEPSIPIDAICGHCHRTSRVKDELAGKKFRCPGCRNVVVAPRSKAAKSRAKPPPTSSGSRNDRNRPSAARRRVAEPEPYDGNDDASSDVPRKRRKTRKKESLRQRAPGRFQDFDAATTELAVFYIGLGMLVAGFGAMMRFAMFDPAGDVARQQNNFLGMAGSGSVMVLVGALCFTRSVVYLHLLRPLNFLLAGGAVIVAFIAGPLLFILPVAFVMASTRINKAIKSYPRE